RYSLQIMCDSEEEYEPERKRERYDVARHRPLTKNSKQNLSSFNKVVQRLTKLVATNQPQVDVCSTCEDLNTKIKSSTLNNVAKRAA
ncbi:hypothetical protein L9F63_009932, partial [Diploptera punctata]